MLKAPLFPSAALAASAIAAATCCFCPFAFAADAGEAQARHAMTLDDLDLLQEVDEPRVSPDGKWVAYTVARTEKAADKSVTDLWMVNWEGTQEIRLTYSQEASVSQPRWSPDGRYLSFLSDRPGAAKIDGSQVWALDRRGGEAHQLTAVKDKLIAYEWSPDGRKLLLTITEDVAAKEKEKEDKARSNDEDADKDRPKPIVIDRLHFKQDVEGYLSTNTRPSLLYVLDLGSGKLEKLTTDTRFEEREAAWSPDGKQVAYVSNHDPDPDRSNNTDVFVVSSAPNSAARKLTVSPGADGAHPAWSPDGKTIAYIHGSEPKYDEYNRRQLAIVPVEGGESRILGDGFDRSVAAPSFTPDGQSISVLVDDDRSLYPAMVDRKTGKVRRLIDAVGLTERADRWEERMAVTWTTDSEALEVYAQEGDQLRRLSHQNDSWLAKVKLSPVRDLQARTADGAEVHGLLALPFGYVKGTKYPLLLRIHGGPDWQDYHDFSPERQLFASRGYAVLSVNYRGSSGRDTTYQQAILKDWGNKEVVDLLASVDQAIKEGVADPDRLGVGGWSYGGMLTDYTIATTTRFKAAISGAGTGNPFGLYGVDEYILQYQEELGPPWKSQDTYIKLGYPFLHADRIKTPTLFMGGDQDFNVPLSGGEQMYQALRSLNVPTELVIYPGEFHEFTRPSFIRDRYERYFRWYDRYLMGKSSQ